MWFNINNDGNSNANMELLKVEKINDPDEAIGGRIKDRPEGKARVPRFCTSLIAKDFNNNPQSEHYWNTVRALIITGKINVEKCKYKESLIALEKSLELLQQFWSRNKNVSVEEKEDANESAVQENEKDTFECSILTSDAFQNMGLLYAKQMNYTMAEVNYRQAILWKRKSLQFCLDRKLTDESQREKMLLSCRLQLSNMLQEIGAIMKSRGDFRGSAGAYNEALKLREKPTIDRIYPEMITILKSLSDSYISGEQYTAALKCLQILISQVEITNLEKTELLIQISSVHCGMENLSAAMRFARLAVEKASTYNNNNSDGLGHSLGKAAAIEQVGNVYKNQIKLVDSMKWYKKAFSIRISVLNEEHPLVANSAMQIADVHRLRGEYEHAKSIYNEIKDKLLVASGIQHPTFCIILDKLGDIYSEQNEYNAAIKQHMKAIRIRRKYLNVSGNPDIADSLSRIGLAFLKKNRKHEAMDHFTLALKMYREAHFSTYHPSVISSIRNMTAFDHLEDDLESSL